MSAENEAIVRRLFNEGLNKGDRAILDELFVHNFVDHDLANPFGDREGVKHFITTHSALLFPMGRSPLRT